MTLYDTAVARIQQLPKTLVQEVNDFMAFLLMKHDRAQWQSWKLFTENLEIAESDFSDYRSHLEEYEERLARGEIQW